ncbi:hypothetical protein SAMN05892877_103401 [Rhizobium subbaraonis]|uniref:Uncharacterized protein n=1 Tax=Rhizobium subbaraonis TaxID=908946 RepID=A0A285U5U6_9HYPH|nr:hypothetical protein [Rhizobium subbaraonis]SOC37057.1 hypothetical protein SAMN05892877_103401 [Rhizobium subbaraonis]
MARGRPKKSIVTTTSEISKEEIKRVLRDYQSNAADAVEAAGAAGQVVKSAIERHNLNRKALRFTLGLAKMDPAKRQTTLRCLLEYAHKLDMFSDTDAFDDILDRMENIVTEVRERGGARSADPVVSQTVN